jgi:hypothetical protein
MEKKTLVVNLFGGPGVGKSTTAAGVFSALKEDGIDCELSTEFAKELVWECRDETFKDEIYIFAKQEHRLFRLNGKVDVIITDHPLYLTKYYNAISKNKSDDLGKLCLSEFAKYRNMNFVLTREKEYNPNGRNQTLDEAKNIDEGVKSMLISDSIDFIEIPGDHSAIDKIKTSVERALGEKNFPSAIEMLKNTFNNIAEPAKK